jgi:hypothetical protein
LRDFARGLHSDVILASLTVNLSVVLLHLGQPASVAYGFSPNQLILSNKAKIILGDKQVA